MSRELDPQVADLLDLLDGMNAPPTYAVTPEEARERMAALFEDEDPRDVGDVTDTAIEGPGGEVPIRIYYPEGEGPHPAHVYFHGGGWVLGDVDTHDATARAIVGEAGCAVVSVDYRLAPEHPFPAALEDGYAATEWVTEHGGAVGLDPGRVAVGGDSAGGNLAAAVALMAGDRDGPDLVHQSLVYPAVNSPSIRAFESYGENGEGYFLEYETMEWFYDRYLRNAADARNEYAAPLLARDLSGLPPATVITAEFDPLRDEGIEYAERLADAGVEVDHAHFEGMIHGFVSLKEQVDRGADGIERVAEGLRSAF